MRHILLSYYCVWGNSQRKKALHYIANVNDMPAQKEWRFPSNNGPVVLHHFRAASIMECDSIAGKCQELIMCPSPQKQMHYFATIKQSMFFANGVHHGA